MRFGSVTEPENFRYFLAADILVLTELGASTVQPSGHNFGRVVGDIVLPEPRLYAEGLEELLGFFDRMGRQGVRTADKTARYR